MYGPYDAGRPLWMREEEPLRERRDAKLQHQAELDVIWKRVAALEQENANLCERLRERRENTSSFATPPDGPLRLVPEESGTARRSMVPEGGDRPRDDLGSADCGELGKEPHVHFAEEMGDGVGSR